MLRVGLTGGIGSGKTTVARIFEILNIPVYNADLAARSLMNEDRLVREAVQTTFGAQAYTGDKLDRNFISKIVFEDPEKLAMLNAIVHPATIADAKKWFHAQLAPYAIKEAALLFEAGAEKDLDYTIGVSSPTTLRVKRLQARDKFSTDQIKARMDKQLPEDDKMQRCDFIIYNDERQLLLPQVIALHKQLLSLAKA